MPTAVIMPKFEMAQETGTVGRWVAEEGQTVAKGDVILEVETDKVTMEVESPANGRLAGICATPGQVVPIGQIIAYILKAGESLPQAGPLPAARPVPQAGSQAVQDKSAADKPAAAKTAAVATPVAARVAAAHGVDLAGVSGTGPQGRVTREDVEALMAAQTPTAAPVSGKIMAVPAARRLARELGVDLAGVSGTGPSGRIQSGDVHRAAEQAAVAAAPLLIASSTAVAAIAFPGMPTASRKIALTNVRRTIAERMAASTREVPQFTVSLDVDMGRSLDFIEELRTVAQGDPGAPKITLTALLVKACAWTLLRHPGANASFAGDHIVEWDEVNIGIATAADQGLVVPVIRNVDRLGLVAIAQQLVVLSGRARENRLRLDDIQGGTFTVSNLGMFGIDRFTAIVNPPQAAILAVGRVAKRAVVAEDGSLVARPMATLTLTGDHRVLDGATAAQWLNTLLKVLEHPGLLLA
jgi:pyruvate dehydrogenase E2 component (dihydrolipoamide acetyltransferase)